MEKVVDHENLMEYTRDDLAIYFHSSKDFQIV